MPEPGPACVSVRDLTKRYGAVEAVRGVSFEVRQGEVFGIVGPNGAGKTSILECVLGLRGADSGSVTIAGVDALRNPAQAKERLGAQVQLGALQDKVTAREALAFFASFYERRAGVGDLLERFGLAGKADAPFDSLSGGQRQRLLLALAFVNNPDIVVLDEPTAGLDVHSRRELGGLVRGMRGSGLTVLLSTHHLGEAEELCDRVAILDDGRIIALGGPAELVSRSRARPRVEVRTARPVAPADAAALAGVVGSGAGGGALWLETADVGATVTALTARLAADSNALLDVSIRRPTLEDVFVELTGRSFPSAAAEDQP
jgi:ABC-2 type transport system ATP-binding protein